MTEVRRMLKRLVVTREVVLAAQGLVELADNRGVGTVDARDRALAAARRIPGERDAYEAVYEEEPAS